MRIPNTRFLAAAAVETTSRIGITAPTAVARSRTSGLPIASLRNSHINPSKTLGRFYFSSSSTRSIASKQQQQRTSTTLPSSTFKNKTPVYAVSLSTLPFIGHFFSSSSKMSDSDSFPVQKSDQEWRAVLSKEQFRILRQKGTEPAGTGKYEKTKSSGVYTCAACEAPLYKSTTKFDSGCGWPAFYEGIPGAIKRNEDVSWGMKRIEIVCSNCGGHLGHVFKGEGFDTPTDERHCVNSVSLKLDEK